MAITKIHAIKATVQAAVNYICDKDKTEDELFVSSFATRPETASLDFKFALSNTRNPNGNLAFHLIQSFSPGEVESAEAHEIGKELADRLLQGKYSYIVATHTDRGHIHNHIIFCAANNFDDSKYHDCKASYRQIRSISDKRCRDHNLSVITEKEGPAKTYKEWQTEKNNTSWKYKLKKDINSTIKESNSYEEFLELMKAKGYEIKDSDISETAHKYIAFRAPGQERWIRGREKSLGADFTKERIRERIEKSVKSRTNKPKETYHPTSLIDTSEDKFTDSPGLKRWAEKENLKLAAKIQSELAGRGFKSMQDVEEKIQALHNKAMTAKRTTVSLDKKKKSMLEILTYARQYSEKKRYLHAYKKSKDQDRYYRDHSYDLHLAWGAEDILKNAGLDPEKTSVKTLEAEYQKLCEDRDNTYAEYKKSEAECAELTKYRDTLLKFIGEDTPTEHDKDKDLEKDRDINRTRN